MPATRLFAGVPAHAWASIDAVDLASVFGMPLPTLQSMPVFLWVGVVGVQHRAAVRAREAYHGNFSGSCHACCPTRFSNDRANSWPTVGRACRSQREPRLVGRMPVVPGSPPMRITRQRACGAGSRRPWNGRRFRCPADVRVRMRCTWGMCWVILPRQGFLCFTLGSAHPQVVASWAEHGYRPVWAVLPQGEKLGKPSVGLGNFGVAFGSPSLMSSVHSVHFPWPLYPSPVTSPVALPDTCAPTIQRAAYARGGRHPQRTIPCTPAA